MADPCSRSAFGGGGMVQVTLGTLVPGLGSVTQPAKGSLEGLDSVTAVFVSPVEITVGILRVWRGFQCDL